MTSDSQSEKRERRVDLYRNATRMLHRNGVISREDKLSRDINGA